MRTPRGSVRATIVHRRPATPTGAQCVASGSGGSSSSSALLATVVSACVLLQLA